MSKIGPEGRIDGSAMSGTDKKKILVACADIGSVPAGNFGWWTSAGLTDTTPSGLSKVVAHALNQGTPVALGFECPLFVPLVENEQNLTRARPGEGSRAWSAGAGCGSLATGLVQVAWVLQSIRRALHHTQEAFFDWHAFDKANSGLLIWEAFVSERAKFATHIADAQAGGEAFMRALPDPTDANAINCTSPVYSLAGATLLRTGWTTNLQVLYQACLVLRAEKNIT